MATWATYDHVVTTGWTSEAAAWAQAAGSIAAIVGAAWIAQGEARRARRARRTLGEEAAWFARYAIVQAQFECQIIAAELVNSKSNLEKSNFRNWRQRGRTVAISLNTLVDKADYVHPSVVHVLANAKVLVDDLVDDLTLLDTALVDGEVKDSALVERLVAPHLALRELIELYDSRMRGVKLALDEGDDALPHGEWPWNRREPTASSATGGRLSMSPTRLTTSLLFTSAQRATA